MPDTRTHVSDWDVIVAGAGPAGSTAALAARRANPAARVLLLDAAVFPRDKACGDGIAPHALDVLAELGVPPAQLTAATTAIQTLRLRSPAGIQAARAFARPAWVVPRRWFDHRLVQHAQAAGATLRQHRVRHLAITNDSVLVDGQYRTRVLIGADGAESVIRRAVAATPPPPASVALAIRGYLPADRLPAAEQLLVMSAARWPAYAWAFPIGNGLANIGYGELPRTGQRPNRSQLLTQLAALLPDQPVSTATDLRAHRLPLSPGRPAFAHGPVLLAGDAACLINPLTGEGIYYAIRSGQLAGAAATTPDPARTYRHTMRRHLGRHLRHTDLLARANQRPGLIETVVAASRANQHAFDGLVELGLAAGTLNPSLVGYLLTGMIRARRPH
ncbi:MAG TPA: geranylgeranyl reductase family protein [Jatrophihabitans sp.]|nr:geranylgeranyl reductase family protein [Jatrophihabitans sp.]